MLLVSTSILNTKRGKCCINSQLLVYHPSRGTEVTGTVSTTAPKQSTILSCNTAPGKEKEGNLWIVADAAWQQQPSKSPDKKLRGQEETRSWEITEWQ